MSTNSVPPIVALVPMREHSERVEGKNYRPLAGKPLYAHVLESLAQCPEIAKILVDTDSPHIREGIAERFSNVQILERPAHLRGEAVSMNDVLVHDVRQVPAKFYLQTHSTNPFLRSETISKAIATFLEAYPQNDSLFSVTRFQSRLWNQEANPVNHDPEVLLRTQDLPALYEENSCLYIFEQESFLARANRVGKMPILFEIEAPEALDIDEELDFALAECLMRAVHGEAK